MSLTNSGIGEVDIVTLPNGERIDMSHFGERLDWRIYGKEMPLLFKKPEDYFKYKFGDDWHTIFRLEDQLRNHIEQMEFTQDRLNSGWWGYKIKYVDKSQGSYLFDCIWGCDEPCDPGIITTRYTLKPSISILEKKEIGSWSPHFR